MMICRYFIYFTFALLFALTQQAAVTHEISHISDVQQNTQKQDKTTHLSFCEKCVSFGELANSITCKSFAIELSAFNCAQIAQLILQDFSNTYAVYSARAPPLHV